MGLKADIDEVTAMWARSPWRLKLILLLMLFLSVSSIASLSEAVFKWKGFVLDAVTFYRSYIAGPVSLWFEDILGHTLPVGFMDAAIVYTIFFVSYGRIQTFRQKDLKEKAWEVITTFCVYFLFMFSLISHGSAEYIPGTTFSVLLFYPLALFFFYIGTRGAERILAMSSMLSPVFLVCILGAISSGLNR